MAKDEERELEDFEEEDELEDALEDEDDDEDEDLDDEEEEDDEEEPRSRRPQQRRPSRPSPRRAFGRRPRLCQFCSDRTKHIDYKQVDLLRRYVTDQGKLRGRRETGTCAKHQRMLTRAVKRARHMALLSYVGEVRR